MKITVTKGDIRLGRKRDAGKCPVARAARRTMRSNKLTVDGVLIWSDNNYVRLPAKAIKFILDFDSRKTVKPFSFTVRRPR